jgi:hypothetical protein
VTLTLLWIVLASLAVGVLSVCAATFALWLRAGWVSTLGSVAGVGLIALVGGLVHH